MRLGVIERVESAGDLVQVFVRVDGDIEGPCPVAVAIGAAPDIGGGDPCALFPLEGPSGEFAAVPMRWLRASATAALVALFDDVASVKDALINHVHISAPSGSPTGGPISSGTPIDPEIQGADLFKVTHG